MTFITRSFLFAGREGWRNAQNVQIYVLLVFIGYIEEKVFLKNFILVFYISDKFFFYKKCINHSNKINNNNNSNRLLIIMTVN